MAIPVKINVFEGPLDLLLHLIEKNTDKLLKQLTLKTLVDSSLEYSQSGQEMYYI